MDAVEVTSADIARLAGVRPTAVSNWRRRHPDFPEPIGGTAKSPRFSLLEVREWLASQGKTIEVGSRRELGQAVSAAVATAPVSEVLRNVFFAMLRHATDGRTDADRWRKRLVADTAELAGKYDGLTGAPEPGPVPDAQVAMLNTAIEAAKDSSVRDLAAELYDEIASGTLGKGDTATPAELAALMVALADPGTGPLLDVSCGAGSILLAAAHGGCKRLLGIEANPARAELAALRLEAVGLGRSVRADVQIANALREEPFGRRSASAIASHLPFNDRAWADDVLADESQWPYGIPPGRESELAWLQRALAYLKPGGTAVLVMPPAAADRPSGRRIRRQLLAAGVLRAIVALPRGCLHGISLAPHLWLLSEQEAPSPSRNVLMADFSGYLTADRQPAWDRIQAEATEAWAAHKRGTTPESESAFLTPVTRILQEHGDLTPVRYLPLRSEAADLDAIIPDRDAAVASLRGLADRLAELPTDLGDLPRPIRWVTLEQLDESAELSFHRGLPPSREAEGDGVSVKVVRARPSRRRTDGDEYVLVDEGHRLPEVREGDLLAAVLDGRIYAREAVAADLGAAPAWGTVLIRTDPRRIDPVFLARFLATRLAGRQISTGSTSIGTNTIRELRRVRIGLPEIGEQRRHADFFQLLSDIDAQADPLASQVRLLAQHWTDNAWTAMTQETEFVG